MICPHVESDAARRRALFFKEIPAFPLANYGKNDFPQQNLEPIVLEWGACLWILRNASENRQKELNQGLSGINITDILFRKTE
jgi:hypothetical protein